MRIVLKTTLAIFVNFFVIFCQFLIFYLIFLKEFSLKYSQNSY